MLKRFIVFTGHKDQCQSGLGAIDSHHDTKEQALARGKELTGHRVEWDDPDYEGDYDENDDDDEIEPSLWAQIVDTDSGHAIGAVVAEMGYEVP